jgi:copper(I)-binding protein
VVVSLKFMRRSIFFATLLLSAIAFADDPLPVKITGAWVRAVPPSVTDTAAFMRLQNTGDAPLRLIGATTPIAAMAMPMATTRKVIQGTEILGMKAVDFIEIPPHGEAVLRPGGNHLMLMNLTAHPHPGDKVTVVLEFAPAHQKLTVEMPAQIDVTP